MNGKRAIVTGGSRGIGRAIVEALLAEGATVTFCGVRAESVKQTLGELKSADAYGVCADVSQEDDVAALFQFGRERMGGLDILVASAGIGVFAASGEMSIADWKRTVEINLTGAFLCSQLAVREMRAGGGGHIVHISSLAGSHPFAGGAAYTASKAGLNAMSEAMMLDHRHDGIRVTTISPGSVNTEFSRSAGKGGEWKIQAADVARMVVAVLSMPERTLVSRVEIRPSRPPK